MAPTYSNWVVPDTAKRITRLAEKEATTKNLTGGARPIAEPSMAVAISRRMDTESPARWQAVLFGMVCYTTVSRGAEVFNLTKAQCCVTDAGVMLSLGRTKTGLVGAEKLVPFARVKGTNPGRDLKLLLDMPTPEGQRIWRDVYRGKLVFKNPISEARLRADVREAFGANVTWHSFRKGATSALILRGTPVEAIVPLGTWANPNSLRPYIANAIRTDERFARERLHNMIEFQPEGINTRAARAL